MTMTSKSTFCPSGPLPPLASASITPGHTPAAPAVLGAGSQNNNLCELDLIEQNSHLGSY